MSSLRQKFQTIKTDFPGSLLEDKHYALALHYRQVQSSDHNQIIERFLSVVHEYQRQGAAIEVVHGKKVLEIRPLGVNKGKAVQFVLQSREVRTLPLYLGNDTTDEDAFRALRERGITILVADQPQRTAARYYLKNPEEVLVFLSHLLT